ncbi:DUF819 family protein [Silvanigrella aquatica]|uniref:DUF819 domain-containing protein n=1 Tax=Silvanigrella aquatica TaxID=1915309 RepID=A0A1L4D475_9BACT|nr:DUF819 family protein [Silvanigrella aquatica]APJ04980.1 hypothetical protein AXG55_14190 [Silvanigrella aquatica]
MSTEILLLIIFGSAFACYYIERKIAWIFHASSVCLLILFAMFLNQIGFIPTETELYDHLQSSFLLIAIVMITLNFNFKDILKIPLKILIVFVVGAIGSMVGGILCGYIASYELGIDAYKIAAQLTASYIGGLENAAAMQKVISIPNHYFIASFTLDNVVTSLWIIICIYFSKDKKNEIDIEENDASSFDGVKTSILSVFACFFVALSVLFIADYLAKHVGYLHKILWLSLLTIIAGHIPFLKEFYKPGYVIGAILFSGFFFAAGAISDLNEVMKLPKFIIAMPFIIVFVHAIFIIAAAKILKLNNMTLFITSQTLIGGPGTAVAIAQAKKWKSGVSIGIILGVFGYSIANFFGVFVFNILQFFAPQ